MDMFSSFLKPSKLIQRQDFTDLASGDTAWALLKERHFGARLYNVENRDTRPGGGISEPFLSVASDPKDGRP